MHESEIDKLYDYRLNCSDKNDPIEFNEITPIAIKDNIPPKIFLIFKKIAKLFQKSINERYPFIKVLLKTVDNLKIENI